MTEPTVNWRDESRPLLLTFPRLIWAATEAQVAPTLGLVHLALRSVVALAMTGPFGRAAIAG